MAFLDNSGDIILDTVLTDEGRKRLAAGTFRVAKFALSDDEINYGLYDKSNPSGSAYFDLSLLALPVEIAHTDASISLKHKLFSITNQNLLYLPELRSDTSSVGQLAFASGRSAYALIADDITYDAFTSTSSSGLGNGFMDARTADGSVNTLRLRTPLGINNADAGDPITTTLSQVDSNLDETQYSIIVDDRFIKLVVPGTTVTNGGALTAPAGLGNEIAGSAIATPSARSNVFSGDDNLRVYDVTTSTEPTLFLPKAANPAGTFAGPSTDNVVSPSFVITQTNQDYIFTNYRTSQVTGYAGTSVNVDVIQTSVKIVGNTTGLSITIPVELVRTQR